MSELDDNIERAWADVKAAENAVWEARQRARELDKQRRAIEDAAAGDPQVGDVIIMRQKFVDAHENVLGLVTERYRETDYDTEMVAIQLLDGGAVNVPLSVTLRVVDETVKEHFTAYLHHAQELTERVLNATGRFPAVRS